ncbi:hypothetical protein DOY81_014660 [Sarcophaga bullata]|nr:hypothetical protein DOY81_014660 [Sarcophaga bullata]
MSDMDISSMDIAENIPPDSYDTGANMGAPPPSAITAENIGLLSGKIDNEKKVKNSKDERSPSKSKDCGKDRDRERSGRDREDKDKSRKKRDRSRDRDRDRGRNRDRDRERDRDKDRVNAIEMRP